MEDRIAGIGCLTGIAPWKRRRITAMLRNAHGPRHASSAARAVAIARANGGAVAGWASRLPEGLAPLAAAAGVPVWLVEDGFIRSAGLGADLVQPCSIVVDGRGLHYDPAQPSDLEVLLQTGDFSAAKLARAAAMIARIRAAGVTKYNLAGTALPPLPTDRRIALVLGQVDDDLSVIRGGGGIGVAELVRRARAADPDAFLIYKPHPDVVAKLRGGVTEAEADLILPDARLTDLFAAADTVHTLTSLAGFEALLRGCAVVVHGQPFYAGWGLTRDLAPVARRTRRLTLEQLVAGVLIDYPVYGDPRTGQRCSPEQVIEALAAAPQASGGKMRRAIGQAAGWLASRPPKQ